MPDKKLPNKPPKKPNQPSLLPFTFNGYFTKKNAVAIAIVRNATKIKIAMIICLFLFINTTLLSSPLYDKRSYIGTSFYNKPIL